ncbi:MAG TPA: PIG-L family deacetylase [Acidimicrobiales bacterium]|jgi:LmbE family N-acetylglucosaminyl deacetylase|nr:PIG-L family deacetylase [Acidimicrobiales bacterium]
MILDATPTRALAVFAHPDDPEVACAGTLATWTASGAEIHLVIVNAGDKGSSDPSTDALELARVRRGEAERAAEIIGLASVRFLDEPDGELENTSAFRSVLIELVRSVRPDVMIAPDPTAVFFGDTYVNHHDHRALGWAVLDIAGSMAGGALYRPDLGTPHQIATLLLAGTLEPDTWVQIDGALDTKLAAVRCHASQLGGHETVAELFEARAAEAGRAAGVRYAEGFRRLSFRS